MTQKYLVSICAISSLSLALFWFYTAHGFALNGDVAWLHVAADRLLSGEKMSEAAFGTNPPLSFLIYAPSLFLESFGLSISLASFVYTSVLLVLFSLLLTYSLRKQRVDSGLIMGAIAGFLVALIPLSQYEYGQKDQMIAMALPVFMICQLRLMPQREKGERENSATLIAILLICCPFLLVKPHTLLAPLLIFLWRFLLGRFLPEKSIKSILKVDFFVLLVSGLIYTGVSFVFFPDFFSIILNKSVSLYVVQPEQFQILKIAALGVMLMASAIGVWALKEKNDGKDDNIKDVCWVLWLGAFASFVSYVAQAKGYSVHLLPFWACFLPLGALLGGSHLKEKIKPFFDPDIALTTTVVLVTGLSVLSINTKQLTDDQITELPLSKYLTENAPNKSVFVQHINTNLILPTAVHNDLTYASRFPYWWFVTPLQLAEDAEDATSKSGRARYYFAGLMADDIDRYEPDLILLVDPAPYSLDVLDFVAGSDEFADIWDGYEKVDTLKINRRDYFKGSSYDRDFYIEYAVYKRVDD